MEFIKAVDSLAHDLEYQRHLIEEANQDLRGFDEESLARHLLEFRNIANPDEDDASLLLDLVIDGRFTHWTCPTCETEVYEANVDDWGDWQGISGLQDFASYPGRGPGDKRCDVCRCHMIGDAEYDIEGGRRVSVSEISAVIRDFIIREGIDPQATSDGNCEWFAEEICELVPDANLVSDTILWSLKTNEDGFDHAFVEHKGLFYDSETPDGVDDWALLPFFVRERRIRTQLWRRRMKLSGK